MPGVEIAIPGNTVWQYEHHNLLLPKGAKPTHKFDGTPIKQTATQGVGPENAAID